MNSNARPAPPVRRRPSLVRAFTACAILACACASWPRDAAKMVVSRWSPPSAAAGRMLVDQYGVPDDAVLNRLTWVRRGAWKRIVVWNRRQVYRSPEDLAVIQQTVDYPLDLEQTARLLAFHEGLEIDLPRGELSSRAAREELNYLALNLADEIIRGRKSVEQAKTAYARVAELTAAGKSSPYTQGLLFPAGR